MQTETKTITLDQFGWTFRNRPLEATPARVLLLLHGWTGDENSMWTFTRNFPAEYSIMAPRAPFAALPEKGGYSWRDLKPGTWGSPTLEDLHPAANALVSLVDEWRAALNITSTQFDIVGFSQGGALANVIAALYPARVRKMAILAGFIPKGVEALLQPTSLENIRCFWAHGTQDEMVSFARGQQSIEMLENAGAIVQFCEADVGHRVSKDCRRSLDAFLSLNGQESV